MNPSRERKSKLTCLPVETTFPAHEREGTGLGGEGTGGGGLAGSFRALDRRSAPLAEMGLFRLGTTAFLGIFDLDTGEKLGKMEENSMEKT